ncbi:E3 ubiquitin-protein ligase SINA-like 10 [Senna tora]|uniref:E3 ubiquitin-protein ligase SINA-like 10 n=1 Tax=Senna tora TaxID=362788 RepID=A0A834SZ19_9FABA|nr:E3 ubiquitin-protein ligase SINA-like 10 [Senna tora]
MMLDRTRRMKKKNKELSVPRPACSWVYFSKDFIKEYIASHPESSGLKALFFLQATKAASDAWKSMSHEEKEKYTRHAREVWDCYLNKSPIHNPKPRKQTKLVTRCSPGRLFNLLQRLTPEQKDAVKSMGFGSLLGLRCRTLRRSLCHWLLERFNTTNCSLEICNECIPLTPKDVEIVMGLSASGKDVVNSGPDDLISDLRNSYNATNHGISVRLLEERLAGPEAGEDFRRSFVLYALGTLLSPTARLDVSPSFLHFLTNMDLVHQYNWGKFLLDRLVREVTRFRQGRQQAVGGCLLFLQLFYYEIISFEDSSAFVPTIVPCLFYWGEEEITEREKREKELGGYGFGEDSEFVLIRNALALQVIYKEKCHRLESEYRGYQDGQKISILGTGIEYGPVLEQEFDQDNVPDFLKNESLDCGDVEVVVESIKVPCQNREYGCNETLDYMTCNDHEATCIYAPCACPLQDCNYVGSSEQLALHFSSRHWDSGRRFKYNYPLTISLHTDERYLVLQAEEDGVLFVLNKGTESLGNTVMITCVGPSSSKERFSYDIVSSKGSSSLSLKSMTKNFPQWMEDFPPMDFLMIPSHFLASSRQLNLDICIWNSKECNAEYS